MTELLFQTDSYVRDSRGVGPLTVVGYESKGRINKRIRVALSE